MLLPPAKRRALRRNLVFIGLTLAALLLIALLVLAVVGAFVYYVQSSKARIPRLEPVDEYRYLNSGWQQSARETYYHTPQGAAMPQGARRLEIGLRPLLVAQVAHHQRAQVACGLHPRPARRR